MIWVEIQCYKRFFGFPRDPLNLTFSVHWRTTAAEACISYRDEESVDL